MFAVPLSAQKVALKNNLLYDATTTLNLSLEVGLAERQTLDIGVNYNPFEFSNDKKIKHLMLQPEYRWWCCERFNGSFWGAHLLGGIGNAGNIKLPFGMYPGLKKNRAEGWFIGAGVSYGYQWILGKRWNLEAGIGAGYIYFDYDMYNCGDCGDFKGRDSKHYFGLTKAAISLVFIIK